MLSAIVWASPTLFAQNYSWDARRIGMGGTIAVGAGNIAFKMVPAAPDETHYRSIAIPLGLIQVLTHLDTFDIRSTNFDSIRAVDYIGDPFHYTFNRSKDQGSVDFLKNIYDAGLSRDLNAYRGFSPPESLLAEGLLAPNWGHTFKFLKDGNHTYQGIYLGAGPYISARDEIHIDQGLINILDSSQTVAVPANATFRVTNAITEQAAVAITGGYRGKFPFSDLSPDRDGIYFAADFNYLIGLHYDVPNLNLRIDTDSKGLVTLVPSQTPLLVDYLSSTSGRGFSVDLGVAVVRDRWEFGLGADGVANHIDWAVSQHRQYSTSNLLTRGGFA